MSFHKILHKKCAQYFFSSFLSKNIVISKKGVKVIIEIGQSFQRKINLEPKNSEKMSSIN